MANFTPLKPPTSESEALGELGKWLGPMEETKIKVQQFTIRSSTDKDPDEVPWGYLELGHVKLMDVLRLHARYKAPDGDQWLNISTSTTTLAGGSPTTGIKYVKHRSLGSPFAFTFTVKNFGSLQADLTGELRTQDNVLEGNLIGTAKGGLYEINFQRYTANLQDLKTLPKGASLQNLLGISPMGWVKHEGQTIFADKVQRNADKRMQLLMLHCAIGDQDTKELLLAKLDLLTDEEHNFLQQNQEFLKRGGVHLLAEGLKKNTAVPMDSDVRAKIKEKFRWYIPMILSVAKPPEGKDDPVVKYGWDRVKNKGEIEKLRQQYMNVSSWCYRKQYMKECPEWNLYVQNPVYWFKRLATYLTAPPVLESWLSTLKTEYGSGSTPKAAPSNELREWSTKLTILKEHAEAKLPDGSRVQHPELDVEEFCSLFVAKANEYFLFSQRFDKAWASGFKEWSAKWNIEYLDQIKEKADTDAGKMKAAVTIYSAKLGNKLFNELPEAYEAWRSRNLPPRGKLYIQTVGEIDEWVTNYHFKNMSVDEIFGEVPEAQKSTAWFKKLKGTGVNAVPGLAKMIFYLGSLGNLAYHIFSGNFANNMSVAEMIDAVITAGTATLEIFKKASSWAFSKYLSMQSSQFIRPVMKWTFKVANVATTLAGRIVTAVVGSLSSLISTLSLVAAVAGIIMAWNQMLDAFKNGTGFQKAFSVGLFILSIVEFGFALATIVAVVVGAATIAAACGGIGIVIGFLALVGGLIYVIFFAPDIQGDIRKYLEQDGVKVGAYKET